MVNGFADALSHWNVDSFLCLCRIHATTTTTLSFTPAQTNEISSKQHIPCNSINNRNCENITKCNPNQFTKLFALTKQNKNNNTSTLRHMNESLIDKKKQSHPQRKPNAITHNSATIFRNVQTKKQIDRRRRRRKNRSSLCHANVACVYMYVSYLWLLFGTMRAQKPIAIVWVFGYLEIRTVWPLFAILAIVLAYVCVCADAGGDRILAILT